MLISKNINVNKRRTSMKLDSKSWETLYDICKTENFKICSLLSLIDNNRGKIGLSLATRIFIISYLRNIIKDIQSERTKSGSKKNLDEFISIIYKKEL